MALDQSALLDLLDVMRTADGGDLMRRLLATILQLLVDAEATAVIGAEPHQRTDTRTSATAPATSWCRRRPGT